MFKKIKIYIITSFLNNWITFILMLILLLGFVAFFTLGERKLMGSIQRRKGPDVVGFWGLLQALADGFKLVLKEIVLPYRVSLFLFLIGPSLVFFLSLANWFILPFSDIQLFSLINPALFYVFISASFNIYGLILSGWSSNSRYAFLGGVRATAQMISYELLVGLVNLIVILMSGSMNYSNIVNMQQETVWFIFPLFPIFLIYLIIMLAETNRTPFDLAEAEAELVAGYNVEYSSILFTLFFLGEYTNMLFLSINAILFFFGGWFIFGYSSLVIFIIKILIFSLVFIWIRGTLPRYRYDQLMEICWKLLLPFLFGFFFFLIIFLKFFVYFCLAVVAFPDVVQEVIFTFLENIELIDKIVIIILGIH